MSLNGSKQQSNSGSPMGTPTKRSCIQDFNESPIKGTSLFGSTVEGSPSKRTCNEDERRSPLQGMTLFGSTVEGSPLQGMTLFGGDIQTYNSPPKDPNRGNGIPTSSFDISPLERHKIDDNAGITHRCFTVNLGSPVPITPLAVPLQDFLQVMASPDASVLSPSSIPEQKSVEEELGRGSYATVFKLKGNTAMKIYKLGKNKKMRMLDNKDLWKHLSAFSRGHENPQFARIHEITIVETEDGWQMHVEQEKCSPLTRDNVIGYIRCIISILNQCLPFGQGEVSPKDVKKFNFGLNADGNVVCIDIDFTKYKFGEVPQVVSSGEFEHGEHTMLMSFVLTILDFFESTRSDFRKDDFNRLNYTDGVLQKWGLLSSDRSVSEIDVDDFRQILRSINPSNGEEPLSDDEINRLVWFLAPESQ